MNPNQFKEEFLHRLGSLGAIQQLLDLLPDVAFFIKDRRSRFVMTNLRAVEACGVGSEEETIGKTGHEWHSNDRMAIYLEQDRQVMESGQPIINAICPAPETGSNALIVYSKIPLRDPNGRIIGLAGIWREVSGLHAPGPAIRGMSHAVETMHRRFREQLSISELARTAGLSRSQFGRQFQRLFRTSPSEYLLRVRIDSACRLLIGTDCKITDIAHETGFFDHSHFSRTFQRLRGIRPLAYRRRHAVQ